MAASSDEDARPHRSGDVPPAMPWWANARLRLGVLLACLGLAILALLTGRGGSASPSTGYPIASQNSCPPATPPLAEASVSELKALHVALLTMMAPLARERYAYGTVTTGEVWSDTQPSGLSSAIHTSRPPEWLWPASFEMRSWVVDPQLPSAHEDVAADGFMFADSAQARTFFIEASRARCHRTGVEGSAAQPPQSRTLAWINPDDVAEQDVFLLRGPRVYRVAVVRPQGRAPSAAQRRAGLARAAALACALPGAGCAPSR